MLPYPFSNFSSIATPRKMFANRKLMNLWQRLFTTIFLVALLVIPPTLQTFSLETYPLDNFVEGIYQPLSDDVVTDLHANSQLTGGKFVYTGTKQWEQVTFGDTVSSSKDFSFQFKVSNLIIRKGQDVLAEITYGGMSTDDFANKEQLRAAISKNWYQANKAVVGLGVTLVSSFILAVNLLFILLGASFFLYLTKKSRLFHFRTFAECYNFSLNCLGFPTIIACLIGLFGQPITTILTLQNILFVLCLLWVFFKTKFRDEN